MLRLKNICKKYVVADVTVHALQNVDLNFRKSEFVSILGPSGSGKTTLLNIIGGLDKYSSGDLFIDGKSTKEFKNHDWDVYRNHKIGFVFQSYNLIPHQTILGNVELALTISGISKKERQERAKKALDKVGLKGLYRKKPNQLSGGQCQRVAIARALVNEPAILLADEPTGALDTVTSVQIMDLIKEISQEKLVIMVTHNPDLAEKYSTRIVRLLDGKIEEDTHPMSEAEEIEETRQNRECKPVEKKKKEKAEMSLWTAFKLSAKNLASKWKRTVMVALAGCIGIVGISAVLSVSNGLQNYIDEMENDMLSGNPVSITSSTIDYSSLMGGSGGQTQVVNVNNEKTAIFINSTVQRLYNMNGVMTTNTITQEYMDYLDAMPEENCALIQYEYGYRIAPNLYTSFKTSDGKTHKMSIAAIQATYSSVLENIEDLSQYNTMVSTATVMTEMPSDASYIGNQYEILYIEDGYTLEDVLADKSSLVAVASQSHNTLNDIELAEYGYFSQEQFLNYCYKISGDERYVDSELLNVPETISYQTLAEKTFTWYPNDTVYTAGSSDDELGDKYYASAYSDGTLADEQGEEYSNYKRNAFGSVDGMVDLNVKCVLKLKEDLSYGCLSSGGLYYTNALSEHIREYNKNSDICQSAKESGTVYNIEMGYNFKVDGNTKTQFDTYFLTSGGSSLSSYISAFFGKSDKTKSVVSYSLSSLGGEEFPSSISFYCVDFAQKDLLTAYLDVWNDTVAANAYQKDTESGFYIGKVTDENGVEKSTYYYYNEMTEKYYPVNISEDGYAYDFRWNKYKLIYDEENDDCGFYQKLSDQKGDAFTIDGAVELSDTISVSVYSVASYILFGDEFQNSNPYYNDLENAGKGEALFRYQNSDGGYEYVMKVQNQSYYKVSLDKDGNVLATQDGYEKYRYDEETDTFYQDEYTEEKVMVGEEEVTRFVLVSTAVDTDKVNLFADDTVYSYANVVKNPSYTIAGEKYILNTLGFYVDTTSLTSIDFSSIKKREKLEDDTTLITLSDYSTIDFYYKDETDTGYTYYYVDYGEEDGVSYLYANDIASYINSSSLGGINVEGYISDRYILNDDGTLQALTAVISDTSLTVGQLLELKVIGEPLTDCSILEPDTSKKITYTDTIGMIVAMVNTLIEMITYALIAFTALSLFVSTVMIGIITYVSVVERTKEIGVIRSLGGRKRDVSNLFIAETFIIGLTAGLFGVAITYILDLVINAIIGSLTGIYTLATFPVWQAVIMVLLSVVLTTISGAFPARSAAKKDPVVALRTE